MRSLFHNPVLMKELRMGLREKRVLVIQIGYLVLLAMVAILNLADSLEYTQVTQLPRRGRAYFETIFWVQFIGILVVTPGLTSSSISAERERKSLDMMLASRLAPWEIALGKLGFAVSYMTLVVFSTLPLMAVVFFMGGVSPLEFLATYLLLLATVFLASQLGLVFSSRETRTAQANSHTYGVTFLAMIPAGTIVSLLRYGDPPPEAFTFMLVSFIVTYLYVTVFFHLKILNNLRAKAANLHRMGLLTILYYFFGLGSFVWLAAQNNSDMDGAWFFLYLVHAYLFAVMPNDPGVDTRIEFSRFRARWLGRIYFWNLFLTLGIGGFLALDPSSETISVAAYSVLSLNALSFAARAISQRTKAKYSQVFVLLCAICWCLPTLTVMGGNPEGSLHPVYISTLYFIVDVLDSSGRAQPVLGFFFYAIVGAVGYLSTRKEPRVDAS